MKNRPLFKKISIYHVLEQQRQKASKEIYSLETNYLLNTSEPGLILWLVDKLKLVIPEILDSEIHLTESGEARLIWGQMQEAMGYRTIIAIPFLGDSSLFDISPSSYSHSRPCGEIVNNEIRISYEQLNASGEVIKKDFGRVLAQTKQYLGFLSKDLDQFNIELEQLAKRCVVERKKKLLEGAGLVESLGLPLKRRENAPTTYAVPVIQKKSRVEKPIATTKPFRPEPILPIEDYENILSIVNNMLLVIEKSPRAFEEMGEDDLRTQFLVQLNGQYEGQATGETFNYQGKTDILISNEGKNIFIAECKFWHGEQNFLKTIDQLTSYLSWRDTKTAILVFNRNENFTKVLSSIEAAAPKHPCFKRYLERSDETVFKYIFHQPEDQNREIFLTVMAFNIPKRAKS